MPSQAYTTQVLLDTTTSDNFHFFTIFVDTCRNFANSVEIIALLHDPCMLQMTVTYHYWTPTFGSRVLSIHVCLFVCPFVRSFVHSLVMHFSQFSQFYF